MKKYKGILFALISSGTFGLIPLFSISLIKDGIGLPTILTYRFSLSAILMAIGCFIQKKKIKIRLPLLGKTIVLSILYALTAIGLLYSYLFIPSGVATTIHFLYPILVAVIMIIFFKEQKSVVIFFAAIFSAVGVGCMTWSGGSVLNPVGILLVLGIVVSYAVYIVGINKSGVDVIDSQILTFYILLFTGMIVGIFASITTSIEKINTLSQWVNLVLLALLPTVVSNLTLILAINSIGSTITSILGSMEPLVAVCIGVFVFKEEFGIFSFIGFFLVIISVVWVILHNNKHREETTNLEYQKDISSYDEP